MNLTKKIWLTAACFLVITGCSQSGDSNPSSTSADTGAVQSGAVQSGAVQTGEAETAPSNASTDTVQSSSGAIQQDSPQPEMDEKQVVTLVLEGKKRYWHVMAGGKAEDGPIQSFPINGADYRYLGKDIDTKEKLMNFLGESYTLESSESFLKDAKIIEHEGRMAQPNADYGSLLQYDKAKASLIKEEKDKKVYELTVPVGDDPNVQPETITVEVVNVKDKGWRIATPPNK